MKPTREMVEVAIKISRDPHLGLEDLIEKILDMAVGDYDGPERERTVGLCKAVQRIAKEDLGINTMEGQILMNAAALLALRSGMVLGLEAKIRAMEARR